MSNDDVLAAQIKSSIITKIKTQEYLPGELLPSERDFATMYSVSRYLMLLKRIQVKLKFNSRCQTINPTP